MPAEQQAIASDARIVFAPGAVRRPAMGPNGQPGRRGPIDRGRRVVAALIAFYRDPVAWLALAVTSILLSYGGGLLMFWFHAVQLGEGGPQISWYSHWLLDSTFGFVGLTPALVVILPFSIWAADRLAGRDDARLPWLFVAITGGMFALVTVPGPIAHDLFVGRGTWVAEKATALLGDPSAPLAPAVDYPVIASLTQQLGFAVPVYLVSTAVSLVVIRALVGRRLARLAGEMPVR